MKKVISAGFLLALIGCDGSLDVTQTAGYGAARERIFKECLELAKVEQRTTHYADNAEVVTSCGTEAYYLANSLAKSGGLTP